MSTTGARDPDLAVEDDPLPDQDLDPGQIDEEEGELRVAAGAGPRVEVGVEAGVVQEGGTELGPGQDQERGQNRGQDRSLGPEGGQNPDLGLGLNPNLAREDPNEVHILVPVLIPGLGGIQGRNASVESRRLR